RAAVIVVDHQERSRLDFDGADIAAVAGVGDGGIVGSRVTALIEVVIGSAFIDDRAAGQRQHVGGSKFGIERAVILKRTEQWILSVNVMGDGAGEGDAIGVLNEVEIAGLNGAAAIRPGAGGVAGYDGVDEITAGHATAKVRLVADNGAIADGQRGAVVGDAAAEIDRAAAGGIAGDGADADGERGFVINPTADPATRSAATRSGHGVVQVEGALGKRARTTGIKSATPALPAGSG